MFGKKIDYICYILYGIVSFVFAICGIAYISNSSENIMLVLAAIYFILYFGYDSHRKTTLEKNFVSREEYFSLLNLLNKNIDEKK